MLTYHPMPQKGLSLLHSDYTTYMFYLQLKQNSKTLLPTAVTHLCKYTLMRSQCTYFPLTKWVLCQVRMFLLSGKAGKYKQKCLSTVINYYTYTSVFLPTMAKDCSSPVMQNLQWGLVVVVLFLHSWGQSTPPVEPQQLAQTITINYLTNWTKQQN